MVGAPVVSTPDQDDPGVRWKVTAWAGKHAGSAFVGFRLFSDQEEIATAVPPPTPP